jgi:flap endonuclease-1
MGIKNLVKTLKELTPGAFKIRHLSEYKGSYVAIDAFNVMYIMMSIGHRLTVEETQLLLGKEVDHQEAQRKYLRLMRDYIIKIIEQGVAPLFVFDGYEKGAKTKTTDERKKKKKELIDQINDLRSQLDTSDPFEAAATTGSSNMAVVQRLSSLLKQVPYILNEDVYAFQEILSACGLPFLTAKGEGERLCSSLCTHGFVTSVISNDSDNLALGCPHVMIAKGSDSISFEEVSINHVLHGLGLDYKTFVDLCIMCGCDFNSNIPGIGIKKSMKLLEQYGNIEGIGENTSHDISCLNHEICRDLFKIVDPSTLIDDDRRIEDILQIDKSFELTRDTFNRYDLDSIQVNGTAREGTDRVIAAMRNLEIVNEFRIIIHPQAVYCPIVKSCLVNPSSLPINIDIAMEDLMALVGIRKKHQDLIDSITIL